MFIGIRFPSLYYFAINIDLTLKIFFIYSILTYNVSIVFGFLSTVLSIHYIYTFLIFFLFFKWKTTTIKEKNKTKYVSSFFFSFSTINLLLSVKRCVKWASHFNKEWLNKIINEKQFRMIWCFKFFFLPFFIAVKYNEKNNNAKIEKEKLREKKTVIIDNNQ